MKEKWRLKRLDSESSGPVDSAATESGAVDSLSLTATSAQYVFRDGAGNQVGTGTLDINRALVWCAPAQPNLEEPDEVERLPGGDLDLRGSDVLAFGSTFERNSPRTGL